MHTLCRFYLLYSNSILLLMTYILNNKQSKPKRSKIRLEKKLFGFFPFHSFILSFIILYPKTLIHFSVRISYSVQSSRSFNSSFPFLVWFYFLFEFTNFEEYIWGLPLKIKINMWKPTFFHACMNIFPHVIACRILDSCRNTNRCRGIFRHFYADF